MSPKTKYINTQIFKKREGFFFVLCLSFLIIFNLLTFANYMDGLFKIENWYAKWIDPMLTLFTAIAALVIAHQVYKKEVLAELPLRLNVHYLYKGSYVMSCKEAYLSGPDDIRQWSQTIGSQMTTGRFLDFYPYMKQEPAKPFYEKGNEHVLYEIRVFLRQLPKLKKQDFDNLQNEAITESKKARAKILKNTEVYIIWEDNNPDTDENDEILVEGFPSLPFAIPTKEDPTYTYHNSSDHPTSPSRQLFQLADNSHINLEDIKAYLS